MEQKRVTKRDGSLQVQDINKIHKLINWAVNGDENMPAIKGVSVADIEVNAHLQLHDKIKTTDINKVVISSMTSLISATTPNYDQVAARVIWLNVRKEAFGSNHPPHLSLVIAKNVKMGFYDPAIYDLYTEDEIDQLDRMIDHRRDDLFRYAGAEQMRLKYLCQNRKTRKPTESFQFPYLMVAATLFASYPKDRRMALVKDYYDEISTHGLNEPTPVMAGVRTKVRQYSSCTVISAGDSLDSIDRSGSAILRYASQKAGIGLDTGRIRAQGQMIRGGEAISTGQIPFKKKFHGDLKSSAQGGVRGASATDNWPFWHLEWEAMIELKNEKGTDETRIRTLDYSPHVNGVVFERWADHGDLTLFSPEEVPDLYEAFYSPDLDRFRTLYERYEQKPGITKKTVPARELVTKLLLERFEVSRIYPSFMDTVNTQTPFYEPVTSTNLCVEICLPTKPLSAELPLGEMEVRFTSGETVKLAGTYRVKLATGQVKALAFVHPGDTIISFTPDAPFQPAFAEVHRQMAERKFTKEPGSIALCTLGAINVGRLGDLSNEKERQALARRCELAVRAKDALLSYQNYPLPEAQLNVEDYRPLGIGVIGFAHWLAKNNLRWGAKDTIQKLNELMEFISFHLIQASVALAEEFGPCRKRTKYSDGWMPFDSSKIKLPKSLDWDSLRKRAQAAGGTRNATLMCGMPSETSSQLANETNGWEPPIELVTLKDSKDGTLPQVVPDFARFGFRYELRYDVKVEDYLRTLAVPQHYYDQAISLNTSYSPDNLPKNADDKVRLSTYASHFVLAYTLGHKNLYYNNTNTRDGHKLEVDDGCESGACKI